MLTKVQYTRYNSAGQGNHRQQFHTMQKITGELIRKIILNAQGLTSGSEHQAMKAENIIQKLGYVQLDTIHVTQRAHHHIIWSRSPVYTTTQLSDLMAENKVFEYWSHAASILPIAAFPYTLERKKNFAWHNEITDSREFKELLAQVYQRVQNDGALSSADFDDKNFQLGEMWGWKLSRYALEYLFQQGKLMVARREKFKKVYDLTERVYPASVSISIPDQDETAQFQIDQALSALGCATIKDISEFLRFASIQSIKKIVEKYEQAGRIRPVLFNDAVYYLPEKDIELIEYQEKVMIISPFDNLIINRKRLKKIFDLDYSLECYLPISKRKFGFFSMPLLYHDRFIGLIDLKADRTAGTLLIKRLHLFNESDAYIKKLLNIALEEFAGFNSCVNIKFENLASPRN